MRNGFTPTLALLNTELENRITERLGSGINSVTTVSSATAGLTATLISLMSNHK
ncbi:MAG: hypothetical protein CM15mP62_34230 [Rhodospirillaceae bacterium]|nr:MAG: hypothetical protein CM15mP62_34230 [Rhodospirillaceae bacterium]